ncbi:MAG: hypothetical protein RBS80_05870 [Thermoguttaceae bacterium]|nr:hypothetical protein [Thermoguttaceae bacterium]
MEDDWADFLGETLWTLCTRLQAAAEAELTTQGTDTAANLAEHYAPIPLHEDARVVAFHQASLPGPLAEWSGADAPKLDPVRITYIRMVDNVPLRRTFSHYARHVPDSAAYISEVTGWIGNLTPSETPGMVRSLDVFITRIDKAIFGVTDADERLVIQVLCIECPGFEPESDFEPGGNSGTLTEN